MPQTPMLEVPCAMPNLLRNMYDANYARELLKECGTLEVVKT